MEITPLAALSPENRNKISWLHSSATPIPDGTHFLEAAFAVATNRIGIRMWFFALDHGANSFRRIAILIRDNESAAEISLQIQPGDTVSVTATRSKKGNPLCSVKFFSRRLPDEFISSALAAKWCAPLTEQGYLGWPFLRQVGSARRILVIGWKADFGLDEADFTQGYDGVNSRGKFARHLSNLCNIRRLLDAATADRRPVINKLRQFQDGIAQMEQTGTDALHAPTVVYTWLHPHAPKGAGGVPEEDEERASERMQTFRDVFCRFAPELVLVSGNCACRELPEALKPLSDKIVTKLSGLRSPQRWTREGEHRDPSADLIPVWFGPGPFSGQPSFLAVHDLAFFDSEKVGLTSVSDDYWVLLMNFLWDWIATAPRPPLQEVTDPDLADSLE